MMPTSCPPAPTPHHQPRCLVSPLWLFLFIALAVFLQDQLSKNSITTFLKINSGGDQVDPHRPCIIQNSHFWSIYINGRIFQWSTYQKNKNNIATSYTTYWTKNNIHIYMCVYLSSYIYIYKYASGHQFWNISVLLYANSITNVVSYNCCCWCMVCVEILQTQFNILWYNFFLWWSSLKQTNNYWKKILKNWDIIMMMIWSRDLQTIHVRER